MLRRLSPLLAPSLVLLLATACGSPQTSARTPGAGPATNERIARVEHGLHPGAFFEGDRGLSIEDQMREHHVQGVSVAVVEDFHVAWAKGYGFADATLKTPVTETTLFQAGSISKPVAAMAVLRDVQDGRLALEAKINDVLKSWKLPDNDLTRASPVTLRELLSHTAGTTIHGFPGYAAGDPVPGVVQILDGVPPANTEPVRVDLPPGTKFRYSGGGITIAQEALTDVEGKPFPAILADKVLGPIGMVHSTYEQPLPSKLVPQAAAGYDLFGEEIPGKRHVYPEMAAAGLWTTPSDLALFGIELAQEADGKSSRVLSREMADRMLTKVAGTEDTNLDVGLAIFLSRRGDTNYFGHDGADEGFAATLLMNRAKGYGIVVMQNSNADGLMQEIVSAVAREYGWGGYGGVAQKGSVTPARLAALAGTYQVHDDRVYRLSVDGDHLVLATALARPEPLLPLADGTFVRRDEDTTYTFSTAADGKPQLKISPQPGDRPYAVRVADDFTVPLDDVAAGRIDQAAARYRAALAKTPGNSAYDENRFLALGFEAAIHGDLPSAIAAAKLDAAVYPERMTAYDALAQAYLFAGDKPKAIESYRKVAAAFDGDTKTSASTKDALRKKAREKLTELGAPL
ncbi:MAG TPA: serine hydrolase domain-containing protein [Polyangiaceae bacterium]|jgi:CubicO group peptidase (beta-lactamase class C family)